MATREYQFINGPETSSLPTVGTVSASTDLTPASYTGKITGTRAAPSSIIAGTGVAFTGTFGKNIWFIQGSGGAVDVSANPQIAAATNVGQELRLIGRSDTNTVMFEDGTGLSLNGTCILGEDQILDLFFDGTNWVETNRSF